MDQVMKDSSCHDPKMVVYYQEVRWLEDKFDGLELNHILRRDNEAADTLAKIVFDQEPVLSGVFASDQVKPSVCYTKPEEVNNDHPTPSTRADPSPSGADLESAPDVFVVMEVDEDPAAEPDPQAD
jgi:hypothetical protein